jgi:hypothetical protein
LAAAASGCGGDGDGLQTPAECNPLGGASCVTPWPSSIYEVDDPATATGRRLQFPDNALLDNIDGIPIDATQFEWRDGWSAAGFLFTAFPGGVDPSNLPPHSDYGASLDAASPTVIVDIETGERVAHFAEVDVNAGDDYDNQALYLRPAAKLRGGARYAVGIRTSLRARGGGDLPVPEGFAAIRDDRATSHALLEEVRPRYADIFTALETAGVPRDELVVAWDFTTASDESITSAMTGARDRALDAMGVAGANLTYDVTDDAPYQDGTEVARRVIGTYQAPMVLTDDASLSSVLARDANGAPMITGMYDSPFVAMVPECAAAQAPVPIIIFGHGFFGDIKEAQGRYMRQVAQQMCMVVLGTEWRGMAERDIAGAALALNDASLITGFGERIVQGIVNYITLVQLARGAFASDLLVDGAGTSIVDTSRIYYYGISQGHVLGATLMAYEPEIERATLAVGGGPWSLLIERSTQWPAYKTIIQGAYPGPLNIVVISALLQLAFDPTENLHVVGTIDKQLLLHMAVGDSQVSNLATQQQAREIGLPVLAPALYVPYGLEEQTGPLSSALVIYDQGPEPLPPETNATHDIDNDTHGELRYEPAVLRQIETFWTTGEIVNECAGACDCAAGSCE